MKKNLVIVCLCLAFIGIGAQAVTPQDIVGEWTCKIDYAELNILSVDTLDFQKDGSSIGTGLLFVGRDNMFTYESKHSGRWSLNDNILSEISTDFRFAKIHSSQTMKRLESDKALQEFEQKFYQNMVNAANADITRFKINLFYHDQMVIDHLWEDGTTHQGFCKKSKSLNE
ncbi:hypothetical protein RYD26_10780 [Pasteurellaceae bacterium LIM206]|nr:hypothetical protein [Pasteurellaceae bacterium LIM206]